LPGIAEPTSPASSGLRPIRFFAGFPSNPCATCTATTLTFNFTPFLYDPTLGDLLIEVRSTGGAYDEDHIFFDAGFDAAVSSLHDRGGLFHDQIALNPGYGLKTEFAFEPVPEPATLVLFVVGAGSALAAQRRRLSRKRT
jgi:hypothetical protein